MAAEECDITEQALLMTPPFSFSATPPSLDLVSAYYLPFLSISKDNDHD